MTCTSNGSTLCSERNTPVMTDPSPELIEAMRAAFRRYQPVDCGDDWTPNGVEIVARVAQDAVDGSYLAGLRDGRKHAEELLRARYANIETDLRSRGTEGAEDRAALHGGTLDQRGSDYYLGWDDAVDALAAGLALKAKPPSHSLGWPGNQP